MTTTPIASPETPEDTAPQRRPMRLRYSAVCRCGANLKAGLKAMWDVETKTILCLECATLATSSRASPDCSVDLVDDQIAATARIARDEFDQREIIRRVQAAPELDRLAFTLRAKTFCSCGMAMVPGDLAAWDAAQQMVYCLSCLTTAGSAHQSALQIEAPSPPVAPAIPPAAGRHAKAEPEPDPLLNLVVPDPSHADNQIDLAALGIPEPAVTPLPVSAASSPPVLSHAVSSSRPSSSLFIKRAPRSGVGAMRLKFAATCPCGMTVPAGELGGWHQQSGTVLCLVCAQNWARPPLAADAITDIPIDAGIPGGSAQREYERRRVIHRQRVKAQHRVLGRLILRISEEPPEVTSWARGATGERRLAKNLAELGNRTSVLHDRRVPKSRANLDHLVVGPDGVYVIDAKLYTDAAIDIRRAGSCAGGRSAVVSDQLLVSGRDGTSLIEAMHWQSDAVRRALDTESSFRDVPVIPVLCFIEGTFPKWVPRDGHVDIDGVRVRGLYAVTQMVAVDGPYDQTDRTALVAHLAALLPAR